MVNDDNDDDGWWWSLSVWLVAVSPPPLITSAGEWCGGVATSGLETVGTRRVPSLNLRLTSPVHRKARAMVSALIHGKWYTSSCWSKAPPRILKGGSTVPLRRAEPSALDGRPKGRAPLPYAGSSLHRHNDSNNRPNFIVTVDGRSTNSCWIWCKGRSFVVLPQRPTSCHVAYKKRKKTAWCKRGIL